MKYLIAILISFLIVACGGYKPVPEYSNDIFAQPVLTKVKMDPEDPDAGVYLQDELSKMAVNRLNLTLTKNVNKAKGYILVNSYTINTTPTNKDDNGNVIRYSVNTAIEFAIKDKYGFWSKNIVSNQYVSVKAQSLISSLEKEKASKLAIQKALDLFALAVIKRSREVGKNKTELKPQNTSLIEEDTQSDMTQNDVAYNEYQPKNKSINKGFDIKIIPIDSDEDIIKDATNYN